MALGTPKLWFFHDFGIFFYARPMYENRIFIVGKHWFWGFAVLWKDMFIRFIKRCVQGASKDLQRPSKSSQHGVEIQFGRGWRDQRIFKKIKAVFAPPPAPGFPAEGGRLHWVNPISGRDFSEGGGFGGRTNNLTRRGHMGRRIHGLARGRSLSNDST